MTLWMLVLPLLGAAAAAFAPGRLAVVGAVASAVATFATSAFLAGSGALSVAWLPALGIDVTLDPFGVRSVLVTTAALTMVPVVLTAARRPSEERRRYLTALLLMHTTLNGVFLATDLVLMYVFWEATLLPSLFLLGTFGGRGRRGAVTKYLVYAITGSFLMLASILAIVPLSGAASYAFADLLPAARALDPVVQTWLFAGFAAAFAVKLPLFPLHAWLIDFHRENPASGVADVAGTLYKVGGFGFFAWAIPLLPDGAAAFQPILLPLAAATALWGGLAATRQEDLKSMLAYMSLSHMGVVALGVFSLTPLGGSGAMFLLAAQMLSTGALFLIAGMLHERTGGFDFARYGGLAKGAPALAAVTLFALFAAIGVPGLSNFPGEFLALAGGFAASPWLGGVAALGSVVAAGVYGVNTYQRLYQGPPGERRADLRASEVLVVAPLIAGILWLGLAPAPQLERIDASAQIATTAAVDPTAVPPHAADAAEGPERSPASTALAAKGGER